MIDFDKWQEIFQSIGKHKLRTFLTALGVYWGIFMLVLLLGMGNGLFNGIEYEFRDDAKNSLWFRRGHTSIPYKGLPKGRRIEFENDDYDFLKEHFEGVEHITGRFYLSGDQVAVYGDKELAFPTRGVHPGHMYLENTEVKSGRYINQLDLDEIRKVCVIGNTVKRNLFGEENPIGKDLQIGRSVYKVVGVYFDSGGENEMKVIYLPVSTVQKITRASKNLHQLMFTTGNMTVAEMQELEEEVRSALAGRHEFDPKDRQALFVSNNAEEYEELQGVMTGIKLFIWFIGLGSIIAGIIGVSNIMLIVVKDRTKEIGIRKAIGATPYSIISMILQEAVLITGIAGYLGLLSAVGLLRLAQSAEVEMFRNPQIDFRIGLIATIVLVICGALAGLMPAIQASRISPVTAMKEL